MQRFGKVEHHLAQCVFLQFELTRNTSVEENYEERGFKNGSCVQIYRISNLLVSSSSLMNIHIYLFRIKAP